MMKRLLLLLMLTVSLSTGAQNADKLYEEGKSLYDAKKYTEAVVKLRAAANKGHHKAQYRLARCYDKGHGGIAPCGGLCWQQGHAKAQYQVGKSYKNGEGVEKDRKQAVEWFAKAAKQGNADAQLALGKAYMKGKGIQTDQAKAKTWLKRAVNNDKGGKEILEKLKTDEFILHSGITLGYTPALPIPYHCQGKPFIIIPYLRYKITGKVDQTLVFPPRYLVTADTVTGQVVAYKDMACDRRFARIDFNKPIGNFRHAAIRNMKRNDYEKARAELYDLVDTLCNSYQGKAEFDEMDAAKLHRCYATLLEPSVKPFYHAIDKAFFENFIDAAE